MRPTPLALLGLLSCGGSVDKGSPYGRSTTSTPDGDADTDADTDADVDTGEQEEDLLRLPPAQTDDYVFIANPERDTVTRVRVATLAVETTPVGRDPRIVATTPDGSTALVFNRGDHSVSTLDVETLRQRRVEVRENLNDLILSPDGAWAVLWHDTARERPDDPPIDGVMSFSEASFVRVRDTSHQALAVGFDPQGVQFTPDGSLAVIVSDAALALVDLTQDRLKATIVDLQPLVLDPFPAEEVALAPDGSRAWVRLLGSDALLLVDLVGAGHAVTPVPAGQDPTDLDLSPDGRAVVVVSRDTQELYVFDATRPAAPPRIVPLPAGAHYGSLTFDPTGRRAILYTNAVREERYAEWTPDDDRVVEHGLMKPVDHVALSPTGDTLVVFHTLADGPHTEPTFAGHDALTMIDLVHPNSTTLRLPGPPIAYADAASGRQGYFVMEDERYLEVLDFGQLLDHKVPLSSPPVFLGVLPDPAPTDGVEPSAWVSQEYGLGRITFFDPNLETTETLTGFELNAGIEVDQ